MAESDAQPQEFEGRRLRYLEFVQVAAIQAVVCLAGVYGFAKENAGPLRGGVDAVESKVISVVGPVYEKFNGVPLELLAFVDRKVDDAVSELDKHLPSAVKSLSAQACTIAHGVAYSVPGVAREISSEVHQYGVAGAAKAAYVKVEPVAKDLYERYEPVAEHLAVSTWKSLNHLPLFPQVAQILVPTAGYWAEKYNRTILLAAAKGLPAAKYLPAIPTERIAKVFGDGEAPGRTNSSRDAAEETN